MKARSKKKIWVISGGKKLNADSFPESRLELQNGKIYKISEIAKYLLNPSPIEVEERVFGYTLYFKQPRLNEFKKKLKKFLPQMFHGLLKEKVNPCQERIISPFIRTPSFKNHDFEAYLNNLSDLIRPFHPILKEIEVIDPKKLTDVSGICLDIGGSNYKLTLKGSLSEKIAYLKDNIGKGVRVTLKSAYMADGLFEMRGFDFKNYNPDKWFYLVKYESNQTPKYAVLDQSNKSLFQVKGTLFIRFLHILEQSLQSNENLKDAFRMCTEENARPLKLFFTKKLDVNYSKTYLPSLYRRFFDECHMGGPVRELITGMLNNNQRIVTFSYIPRSETGSEKMVTNISVMHDIRALEPVKSRLPDFYSKISKIALNSEAGSYYLLDTMKGFKDV